MDRVRKRRRIGVGRMKECPECGSKMLIEIYKNSIYVYIQHNCVGCDNRGNEKHFNDDGDTELQKLLYGRANNENAKS